MSKKLFLLPALLLGAMLMFAPACGDSDPCKDVECGANGTCFEGACVCNEGYDQDASGQCTVEWSAKYLKTNGTASDYSATSSCFTGSYAGSIARVDATTIRINEIGGYTGTNFINATLTSSTAFTINGTDAANRKFTGTGSISGKVVTISLTTDYQDGTPIDNCTETLTIQ